MNLTGARLSAVLVHRGRFPVVINRQAVAYAADSSSKQKRTR